MTGIYLRLEIGWPQNYPQITLKSNPPNNLILVHINLHNHVNKSTTQI